jgi:hypothetical protein
MILTPLFMAAAILLWQVWRAARGKQVTHYERRRLTGEHDSSF